MGHVLMGRVMGHRPWAGSEKMIGLENVFYFRMKKCLVFLFLGNIGPVDKNRQISGFNFQFLSFQFHCGRTIDGRLF